MTDDSPILLAEPDIGDAEVEAVSTALRSGWLTSGPKVKEFEIAFSQALAPGMNCVAVNSATAGLHLALAGLGVGKGDRVAVPTYTFTATAQVVDHVGADVEFVDSLAEDFEWDLAQVAGLGSTIRAAMPVHFGGLPLRMNAIRTALPDDVVVIDDAAHAFPAHVDGTMVGAQGTAATVFSFYANKTMTTGEGGMICTSDDTLADRCRILRLHGIERDVYDRFRTTSSDAWRYSVVAPGFKYNLTDPAAAMGLIQLGRADDMRARREAIASRYLDAFGDLPLDLPRRAPEGSRHAWHLFVLRVRPDAPLTRDELAQTLAARGIGVSVHYIPLHLHPYWKEKYDLRPSQFPNAQRHFEQALTIPLSSRMTDVQAERVVGAVREALT